MDNTHITTDKEEQNQEIVLAGHPSGVPTADTFRINNIDMPTSEMLKDNEVLIKSLYVSVDPGMRGFMDKGDDDAAGNKYKLNQPITSRSVAQVIKSTDKTFAVDDIVHGRFAWQKYQTVSVDNIEKVDPNLAPISTAVSMLGVPGLAAYFGMLKIGQIKATDTVVVSGAAGSVGSIAAQIARIKGCKVVGIAGSPEKINYLENELGLDKGINYKQTNNMQVAITEACPNGVDVFFDNVGGELFDAILANINEYGRIAICGQIAEYNEDRPPQGPRPMHTLIKKSARMEGYVVFNFSDEFDDAKKQIAEWYNSGQIKYRENLIKGFDNIPSAFIGLFTGENIGKQMVKTGDSNDD
ncbi:NADP-dependent oxidoreductase [Psychrobacter sp. FBL11]|uniref:NADP-dependent oxidoreductase n=1 Tax=Psychrobacter saeujeotis TaxID=3143436 RepID=A0ABU9X740_9GAMM|nr:NADP-dependent oxidoreductase [uncultured Psychrobacter sp.]